MRKVLVVDDEEQIVNALKIFLTTRGYNVFTAPDGPTAISRINEINPLVVLLDIIMPGMNGIDALVKIRDIDRNIRVVMMSALEESELIKKALKLGACDYVIKPFDLDYIDTVISVKIANLSDELKTKNIYQIPRLKQYRG